jgi:hypothetical protein
MEELCWLVAPGIYVGTPLPIHIKTDTKPTNRKTEILKMAQEIIKMMFRGDKRVVASCRSFFVHRQFYRRFRTQCAMLKYN